MRWEHKYLADRFLDLYFFNVIRCVYEQNERMTLMIKEEQEEGNDILSAKKNLQLVRN